VIDVALGLVALALLSPVFVLVAVAVGFSSKGPVMFRQERVGRGQRPFTMFKFRTMYTGLDDAEHRAYVRAMLTPGEDFEAAQSGLHKLDDDRITSVGRVLRRMSLDELHTPECDCGSMSLVGPRPVLPWEVELLDEVDARPVRGQARHDRPLAGERSQPASDVETGFSSTGNTWPSRAFCWTKILSDAPGGAVCRGRSMIECRSRHPSGPARSPFAPTRHRLSRTR
jgi:hypothetical protein